jgi:hypothetical protein
MAALHHVENTALHLMQFLIVMFEFEMYVYQANSVEKVPNWTYCLKFNMLADCNMENIL